MKVLFISIGSRGDIEPFLAQAEVFRQKDWEVICAFPEQFSPIVKEIGYSFHGFDKEFIKLINGTNGRAFTGGAGNWFKRTRNFITLAKLGFRVSRKIARQEISVVNSENPDLIIYHPKCMYPVIWERDNPGRATMLCPVPCMVKINEEHSAIGLRGGGNYGKFLNRLSYKLTNLARAYAIYSFTKKPLREQANQRLRFREITHAINHREKTQFTLSPTLYPEPESWNELANVIGYYERKIPDTWKADTALESFLANHEKIVFISFGSISNPNPPAHTKLILDAIESLGFAAIINTSWGGLKKPTTPVKNIHFVDSIPYNWILPKMYAVIHHGGSGTTHAGLKHGCATMIIPHMIDQFYWNKRIVQLGAGPTGPSISRISAHNFTKGLRDLMNDNSYKAKALEIAELMAQENNREAAFSFLAQDHI